MDILKGRKPADFLLAPVVPVAAVVGAGVDALAGPVAGMVAAGEAVLAAPFAPHAVADAVPAGVGDGVPVDAVPGPEAVVPAEPVANKFAQFRKNDALRRAIRVAAGGSDDPKEQAQAMYKAISQKKAVRLELAKLLRAGKRTGRPRGKSSQDARTARVRATLHEHSVEIAEVHLDRKTGACQSRRVLKRSKRRIWCASPALRKEFGLRQFYRHMASAQRLYRKAHKEGD